MKMDYKNWIHEFAYCLQQIRPQPTHNHPFHFAGPFYVFDLFFSFFQILCTSFSEFVGTFTFCHAIQILYKYLNWYN